MNVMKSFLALAALSVALVGCAVPGEAEPTSEPAAVTVPVPVASWSAVEPMEDEPGWDCKTMGNADCGDAVAPAPEPVEPSTSAAPIPAPTTEPVPWEYEEAVPWVPGAPHTGPVAPQEDDPAFDCRVHGNQSCGVQIENTWYLVTFSDGQPVSVRVR